MRKGRGTRAPPGAVDKNQMEASGLSAVDQASFFEGLEQNDSNPLHSTALEDQANVQETGQMDKQPGQKEGINTAKTQRSAGKRKGLGGGEEQRKKSGIRAGGQRKSRSTQRQQLKEGAREPADEESADSESATDGAQRNRRRRLPSSDEEGDEGSVWNPSPKKAKRLRLGRTSPSAADADGAGGCRQQEARRVGRGGSQLELVLDAFLDFCQQYGESVESAAVRESVDRFSDCVRTQLLEKISSLKQLGALKRENRKVGSSIQTKTQRLLNAKHELMRAERQAWLLEKEKAELQQRLADLRRGQAFLRDVRELTACYLAHRRRHPAEKETFGASSLPALLLETKFCQRPGRPGALGSGIKKSTQT